MTQSAGRSAASTMASGPAPASMPGAGKFGLQLAVGVRIGDRGEARAELACEARQRGGIAVRRHRFDAVARRVRRNRSIVLDPIEPVAPRSETARGARASSARANGCLWVIGLP